MENGHKFIVRAKHDDVVHVPHMRDLAIVEPAVDWIQIQIRKILACEISNRQPTRFPILGNPGIIAANQIRQEQQQSGILEFSCQLRQQNVVVNMIEITFDVQFETPLMSPCQIMRRRNSFPLPSAGTTGKSFVNQGGFHPSPGDRNDRMMNNALFDLGNRYLAILGIINAKISIGSKAKLPGKQTLRQT